MISKIMTLGFILGSPVSIINTPNITKKIMIARNSNPSENKYYDIGSYVIGKTSGAWDMAGMKSTSLIIKMKDYRIMKVSHLVVIPSM